MKFFKDLKAALKDKNEVGGLKVSLKGLDFPEELFELPNLMELYLEGNCTNLPETIVGWKHLKTLSIKWPNFTGDMSAVFALPLLENLKIIETPLEPLTFPDSPIKAPLKFVTLKACQLKKIPEGISSFKKIQDLHLPENKLTSLPYSLSTLESLRRLNLDGNGFYSFPEVFSHMPNLRHLSIDDNSFSDDEKDKIQRLFHITIK